MIKLSVAIATYNEEDNIGQCLDSVKKIADEIIIVDGSSSDKTVEIAKKYGARITITQNHPNFHINKQKSFDLSKGEWVLYLDADERISPQLSKEILEVIGMGDEQIKDYQKNLKNKKLYLRHQSLLEIRDGKVGTESGKYVAFFFPRLNYFLGRYLKYGGVYPDGVIRLFKNKKAYLPCKDVHEQLQVLGKVGWLQNDLYHMDSPTFKRYLQRNSRYINLIKEEMVKKKLAVDFKNSLDYLLIKPTAWFLITQIRHKGILDGVPGVVFSFFSALRFPRAYIRYIFHH